MSEPKKITQVIKAPSEQSEYKGIQSQNKLLIKFILF
jgi:hypothetical protein